MSLFEVAIVVFCGFVCVMLVSLNVKVDEIVTALRDRPVVPANFSRMVIDADGRLASNNFPPMVIDAINGLRKESDDQRN